MQLHAERLTLTLAQDECAHITRARDTRVSVSRGVAWVTIDGQPRDIVLEGGQSFVVDSNEKVVVFALQGPAAVDLAMPAPERREAPRPARLSFTRPASGKSGRVFPMHAVTASR